MTYAIIGLCPCTKQMGIGITTYSLAVGGYCPLIIEGLVGVVSQAFANPELRGTVSALLASGHSPEEAIECIKNDDQHFDYRQIGILDYQGTGIAWTGDSTSFWSGHSTGFGFVALGNSLPNSEVIEEIVKVYSTHSILDLDERLLRALEAGRDAGGQSGSGGIKLPERSSALMVVGPRQLMPLDLRVDVSDRAVDELRNIHTEYVPYKTYYELRATDPPDTPAQDVWVSRNIPNISI